MASVCPEAALGRSSSTPTPNGSGGVAGTTMDGTILAGDVGLHGFDHSAELTLPPLGVVWLCPDGQ